MSSAFPQFHRNAIENPDDFHINSCIQRTQSNNLVNDYHTDNLSKDAIVPFFFPCIFLHRIFTPDLGMV